MTKAKMKKYLRDTIEKLNLMKEPEEFYAKQNEMFIKLKNMPYKEERMESFKKNMAQWEYNFSGYGKSLEFNSMMQKHSNNKKYQKPALTKRFISNAIALLGIHISQSLLPE